VTRKGMEPTQYAHRVLLPALANNAGEEGLARGTLFGKPGRPVYFAVSMVNGSIKNEVGSLRLDIEDGPRNHLLGQF
jgi:hypothetical protein